MTIRLDHARFTTSAEALSHRVEALTRRRADAEHSVDALLAEWRGPAAARFREEWEQWHAGADAVIETLAQDVAALRAAQGDLGAADEGRHAAHLDLRGRLG